jgi:phospholipid-binding lipoprotein MlaA
MPVPNTFRVSTMPRIALALGTALFLGACATSQDVATRTDGINDPHEAANRNVHAFNKRLDTAIVRPVSKGYAAVLPVEVRGLVNNFSDNLSMPAVFINSVLQADVKGAGLATLRFAMNSTIGIFGLVDAATELRVPQHETDFGETLAVWGVGEGAYIELPVFGPSTQRDAVGLVTDFFTNPLTFANLNSPEEYIPPTARVAQVLDVRDRFATTIDSVLYESADSYALSRQLYLQNRRFELGLNTADEIDPFDTIDPYEDAYVE